MGIEKLSRFLGGLSGSADTSNVQQIAPKSSEAAETQAASGASTEAVKLSQGLGDNDGDGDDRAAKVARLKEQVANGSYKPDTRAVASAVAQELFF